MALVELAVLIVRETVSSIFGKAKDVFAALGVDVESWAPGDPTRATLYALAVQQQAKEDLVTGAIKGGYIDTAEDNWLKLIGAKNLNVPIREASYASCTARYTNASGELHTIELNETLSNSATGATYTVTDLPNGDSLPNGATLDVTVTAETAGTASNSVPGDIDTIVTPARPNVSVTNTTAAVGADEEEEDPYRARMRGKFLSLSPNGPKSAYDFVVTTPPDPENPTAANNGGANITRSRTIANSPTGAVTVYCANESGAVTAPDITLAQTAIETWVEPICVGATATNTTNLLVPVTYQVWVYDSINLTKAAIQALIATEIAASIRRRPIGGDIIPPALTGTLYKDSIEAAIMSAVRIDGVAFGFRCTVSLPGGDTAMTAAQVAVASTIIPTVTMIEAPV